MRAEKLREQLAKSKEANDSGKVRRYTRLVQVSVSVCNNRSKLKYSITRS